MAPPDPHDSPRAFPPPLIYGGCFLLGLGLERLWPLGELPEAVRHWGGGALVLVSLALAAGLLWGFRRQPASLSTRRPARALLTEGAFALSRNPGYLSMTLLCAGLGLWLGSPWTAGMALPAAVLTDRFVIRREEAYLERRFGEDYRRYRARVRRWA